MDAESKRIVREQLLEAVEVQIKTNDPPETNLTFMRLVNSGYIETDAKLLIAQCLLIEIYEVQKSGREFDRSRYAANLAKLPDSLLGKNKSQ